MLNIHVIVKFPYFNEFEKGHPMISVKKKVQKKQDKIPGGGGGGGTTSLKVLLPTAKLLFPFLRAVCP